MSFSSLLMLAGTAVEALAVFQQGQAAQAQAQAEQDIAEYNARVEEQRAVEERRRATMEAEQFERKGEALTAEQRVKYGKAGVLMRGTPLTVLESTARELELDRLEILRRGQIKAGAAISEAGISRARGVTAKTKGIYAARGAALTAGGTVLTGIYKSV